VKSHSDGGSIPPASTILSVTKDFCLYPHRFSTLIIEKSDLEASNKIDVLNELEKIEISNLGLKRRDEYLFSRFYFRKWLSKVMGIAPREVPLKKRASGKLSLESKTHFISLSHSKNFLALSLGPREHGIDIEEISLRPKIKKIHQKCFGDKTPTHLNISEIDHFFLRWSLLEAHAKCLEQSLLRLIPYPHDIPKLESDFEVSKEIRAWVSKLNPSLSFALVAKSTDEEKQLQPHFIRLEEI